MEEHAREDINMANGSKIDENIDLQGDEITVETTASLHDANKSSAIASRLPVSNCRSDHALRTGPTTPKRNRPSSGVKTNDDRAPDSVDTATTEYEDELSPTE